MESAREETRLEAVHAIQGTSEDVGTTGEPSSDSQEGAADSRFPGAVDDNEQQNSSRIKPEGQGSAMRGDAGSGNVSSDGGTSGQSGAQHDQKRSRIRSTCDACTQAKVRCTGLQPCERCERRSLSCVYSEKRKCGPKRRYEQTMEGHAPDVGPVNQTYGQPSMNMHQHLQQPLIQQQPVMQQQQQQQQQQQHHNPQNYAPLSQHTVVVEELLFFRRYSLLHHFLPLGITEPLLDIMLRSAIDTRQVVATQALYKMSVSVGALLSGYLETAAFFKEEADKLLRPSFDVCLPEVGRTFLLVAVYHMYNADGMSFLLFINFAVQNFKLLPPQVQMEQAGFQAALGLLTCIANVCVASGHETVFSPTLPMSDKGEDGASITAVSALNMMTAAIYHIAQMNGNQAPKEMNLQLARDLQAADVCPSNDTPWSAQSGTPQQQYISAFSSMCLKVLRGYFLCCLGVSVEEFNAQVVHPVVNTVQRMPFLLMFPLTWHMIDAVRHYLALRGDDWVLKSLMDPLRSRYVYTCTSCAVSAAIKRKISMWWDMHCSQQQQTRTLASTTAPTTGASTIPSQSTHPSTTNISITQNTNIPTHINIGAQSAPAIQDERFQQNTNIDVSSCVRDNNAPYAYTHEQQPVSKQRRIDVGDPQQSIPPGMRQQQPIPPPPYSNNPNPNPNLSGGMAYNQYMM